MTPRTTLPPRYPAIGTQPARLLAAFLLGQQVHPLAGWRSLGIYRLSDTVFRLRDPKHGLCWPIITGELKVKNRINEDCCVALYYLSPDTIEQAGYEGQEFAAKVQAFMSARRVA